MQPEVLKTLPVSGSLKGTVDGTTRALDGEEITLSIGYPVAISGTFSHNQTRSHGKFDVSLESVQTADAWVTTPELQLAPVMSGDKVETVMRFVSPSVQTPKLRRPVAAEGSGQLDVDLRTLATSWDLKCGLNGMAMTHLQGTLVDAHGQVDVSGSLDVQDIDRLMDELPPTSPLPANPPARLTVDYQLGVSHAGATAKSLTAESVRAGSLKLSAKGTLTPRAPDAEPAEHVVGLWPEAIEFSMNVLVKDDVADVAGSFEAPTLEAVGQGTVHDLKASVQASVPVNDPKKASLSLEGELGRLEPDEAIVVVEGLDDYLEGVTYGLELQSLAESGNHVVAMRAAGRNESWKFQAEGEGDAQLEQARFDAVLTGRVPAHANIVSQEMDVKGRGQVVAPVEIIVVGGRELVIIGKMHFEGVDVIRPAQALYGLNGTLELNQSLVLPEEGEKPRWSYVETVNPFKRVDTHKVQPYLHARQSLSFERAEVDGRAVGPFFGEVTWTQNLLSFANVDLELFGGVFVGQSFVNLHSEMLQVGMLGRLTDFDTSLLNPSKEPLKPGSHKIHARIASIYDINRSLAEGRMDVDRLEPEALINFMNVVDPMGENAAFNKARTGLQLAHPESVRLRLDQGYADLAIKLGGVVPVTIVASHLPLRSILHEYGMSFQEKLRKVVPQ